MSSDELQPSKLGTKEHWDSVYVREIANFEETGDEGEIWFGEDSLEKMVDWAVDHISPSTSPYILEIGSGNGTLLFSLAEAGYDPTRLSGVDYSLDAVKLSSMIATSRDGCADISFSTCDFLTEVPSPPPGQDKGEWDLILDKGTYDAISLGEKDETGKSPAATYPIRVAQLLKTGGFFLITSCNFTETELKDYFTAPETRLIYQ